MGYSIGKIQVTDRNDNVKKCITKFLKLALSS